MSLGRGTVAQALVRPIVIVEPKIACQPGIQVGYRGVVLEVDVLVLDRAPQSLDEDVVERAASPIHADAYASPFQAARKGQGGELHALIGVEDLGPRRLKRLLQRVQTEPTVERVGQMPVDHVVAEPINDRHQVHEAAQQRHIRDVGAPDLIGPRDRQLAQQVRIDLVFGIGNGRLGLRIDRLQAHETHQPSYPLAVDSIPRPPQRRQDARPAIERRLEVLRHR